jgi:tetratricopeptide (TPR) repeat protein
MQIPPRADAIASLHAAARLGTMKHDAATTADAWIALIRAYSLADNPDDAEEYGRYAQVAIAQLRGGAKVAISQLGGDDDREATRLEYLSEVARVFRGRPDEAEAYARRARDLLTKAHGPDDHRIADAEERLALALGDEDRLEEATTLDQRVIATRERVFGAESETVLAARLAFGEHTDLLGHPDQAIAIIRVALAKGSMVEIGGASRAELTLARALRHAGRHAEALAADLRALEIASREKDSESLKRGPLAGEGLDELGLGHARAAVPLLEAAVAGRADPGHPGEARFGLARALWESGLDKPRARDAAAKAREETRARAARHGGRFQAQVDAIDAWLASHP